jgi:hypothetical protein
MTTEQYTAQRWVCRRRYAWNTEKVTKSWKAKQIYNLPPVNQPRPHDAHRITHSILHRRATMYLFTASVHYNDQSHQQKHLGSTDNNGKRISLFTKVVGPLLSNRLHKLFSTGVRETGRRSNPSPPSSVTVRGTEPLLLYYASMLSYPKHTHDSNLPVLNTTRKI